MDDALHYYGMPYLYLYALFGHLKKTLKWNSWYNICVGIWLHGVKNFGYATHVDMLA